MTTVTAGALWASASKSEDRRAQKVVGGIVVFLLGFAVALALFVMQVTSCLPD
jgi:hypothetical protein